MSSTLFIVCEAYLQGESKKSGISKIMDITSFKRVYRGCFGKFRIFATRWALRFSKLNKKLLRK